MNVETSNLCKSQILGSIFTIIIGTILHFTYQWSGKNSLVGIVSPINESTWEHLKLLVTPVIIFSIVEYFIYGKKMLGFIPSKSISIFAGMLTIVVLFYSYTGIIGRHFLIADIAIFIIGVLVSYRINFKLVSSPQLVSKTALQLGIAGLIIIFAAFVIFTFYPPRIGLFADPLIV